MDIYFTEKYGKLCELIENGVCETYHFQSEFGEIQHMYIKREIPQLVDGVRYFDIITPYGYGGPIVLSALDGQREELCRLFGEAFEQYCWEKNIVSEFVRFHPVVKNAGDFKDIYHPICIRKTLGTNLQNYDDPVQNEFSKSCRKSIRQAQRAGISYRVTEAPDDISGFQKIYYSTMDRDNATNFYYFGEEYFKNILETFPQNLLYVEAVYENKTIAAGLYFISDGMIHIHLSGTLSEYLYLSPAYILRYAVTLWGKEHGYRMIHHGGGTSNSPDDSLYRFKKQFAQHTQFDFYIGKKVWNREAYIQLCQSMGIPLDVEFFPAYRMK